MKRCLNCSAIFEDAYRRCTKCGSDEWKEEGGSKKWLFAILLFCLVSAGLFITRSTPASLNVKTPLWDMDLHEEPPTEGLVKYQTNINSKPPFFNGSLPLTFTETRGASGSPGYMISYFYHFDSFRNHFIYRDPRYRYSGLAEGVITYSGPALKRAEARVINPKIGNGSLELEEVHYNKAQQPIFYCKSQVSYRTGFKEKEYDIQGKKEYDYYFIWPVRGH